MQKQGLAVLSAARIGVPWASVGVMLGGGGVLSHPLLVEWGSVCNVQAVRMGSRGKAGFRTPPLPLRGDLGESLPSGHLRPLSYQIDNSTESTNTS